MQFMLVEHFNKPNARPVYARFRERGRMAPEGLIHVSSWVDRDLSRCFQLMETDDRAVLDRWMSRWRDLVDFEVFEVVSSAAASEKALEGGDA